MQFIGIDLHTNRFTCCYLSDSGKEKTMATFELDKSDVPRFFATLTKDTVVLIEAPAGNCNTGAVVAGLYKKSASPL
jgi:hypothetical protein